MSSSDASTAESPSPPASPEASFHGPPSLERLVLHFVAAKKSLSSTTHVYRANELVTTSRDLLEDIATLNAKNVFAYRGLDEQLGTVEAIRDAIVGDGDGVSIEFTATIDSLDRAHERLQRTLGLLKQTVVDTALHGRLADDPVAADTPSDTERSSSIEESKDKTLHDFIDENNHEELMGTLRDLIDSFHSARAELDGNLRVFDGALKDISDSISGTTNSSAPPDEPTVYDEPPASLQQLFRGMEEHATEMASLLENLVNHYDLSITALKHTEGGGAAAKEAAQAEDLTKGTPGTEESLYRKTVPEPMDDDERIEMLQVLEKDALEVEDVMEEIRARESEMEEYYRQLARYATKARLRNKKLRHALDLLRRLRANIPWYLDAQQAFRTTWETIHLSMQGKTQEVADLGVFYEHFLSGYDKLLREIARRKAAETQMRRVADKARRDLERLAETDQREREAFMEDVGEYLPKDIWHGLEHEAPQWEIRAVLPGGIDAQDVADDDARLEGSSAA